MMECDGKLRFGEMERCSVSNNYMKKVINEENVWHHNVEDEVEGLADGVCRDEVVQALNEMKKPLDFQMYHWS